MSSGNGLLDNTNPNTVVGSDGQESTNVQTVGDDVPVTEENGGVSEPECYPELREACSAFDIYQIRRILDHNEGLDLNIRDSGQGYTPLLDLISAAVTDEEAKQAPESVRFLVSRGADVNAKDEKGFSGLHHCARWNNDVSLEIAKVLLESSANPSATQRPTSEPQHEHGPNDDGCACGQHIGAALGAAYKGATGKDLDLNKQTKELDVTPLHHACGYGDNLPLAKLLLENGARVEINDAVAGTPFLVAVKAGRVEVCRLLLSVPGGTACLSTRDNVGRLPIHHAAERGERDLVATLIEAGSLVDPVLEGDAVQDYEKGLTPLMLACKNATRDGRIDVIEYLIEHGADAFKVGDKDQTPLLLAVSASSAAAAKVLVKHGADPRAAVGPFEDVNALHMAGMSGAAELCQWLVEEAGLAVESHDNQGYTALINAAGYGNSAETIRTLVSTLGADIEVSIHDGRRPLHFAAFKGQEVCVKELLALGADKEAVDCAGWTPLHFAARYHHPQILKLLLESGAQVGKKITGGPQPKLVGGEEIDIDDFTAADLARIIREGQECVDILVAAGDTLSETTKDLKDEDLWKEEGGQCCVM